MHTAGLVFPLALIAGFAIGLILGLLTRVRALLVVGFSVGLIFLLALVGWFSVELALIAGVVAALPAWGGAALGAAIKRKRGK